MKSGDFSNRLMLLLSVSFLLALCGAAAEKSITPKQRYEQAVKEYTNAQEAYGKARQAAKTPEEQAKIKWPAAEEYAGKFLKIAEDHPDDPAALDALIWIMEKCRTGDEADKALAIILEKHHSTPKIGDAIPRLVFSQVKGRESFLQGLIEKSSREEVKGKALITLGRIIKRNAEMAEAIASKPKDQLQYLVQWLGEEEFTALGKSDPKILEKEAEGMFEKVVAEYPRVKSGSWTLGESAAGELFEMRNLRIGMVAPEIEGEDIDGKKFRLSDYRGKVVVLDFWGDW